MTGDFDLGKNWESFVAIFGAVGALGTAATGLIDGAKALPWGINNVGFKFIEQALTPFASALQSAVGAEWRELVRANWIGGRPKDDQKAITVALIKLGLSSATTGPLAKAGHVDAAGLAALAAALETGADLTPQQLNLLGRFSASVEAQMDAAFERADQAYRSWARFWSGVAAVGLAMVAYAVLAWPAVGSRGFATAALLGVVAVPLAPMVKDLIGALTAAARAVKTARL